MSAAVKPAAVGSGGAASAATSVRLPPTSAAGERAAFSFPEIVWSCIYRALNAFRGSAPSQLNSGWHAYSARHCPPAPVVRRDSPTAEAADSRPAQCGFESRSRYALRLRPTGRAPPRYGGRRGFEPRRRLHVAVAQRSVRRLAMADTGVRLPVATLMRVGATAAHPALTRVMKVRILRSQLGQRSTTGGAPLS